MINQLFDDNSIQKHVLPAENTFLCLTVSVFALIKCVLLTLFYFQDSQSKVRSGPVRSGPVRSGPYFFGFFASLVRPTGKTFFPHTRRTFHKFFLPYSAKNIFFGLVERCLPYTSAKKFHHILLTRLLGRVIAKLAIWKVGNSRHFVYFGIWKTLFPRDRWIGQFFIGKFSKLDSH